MFGSTKLSFAILLIWVAGLCFFVAFHPGGILIYDPNADGGKGANRPAKNPAEVLGYLMSASYGGSGG